MVIHPTRLIPFVFLSISIFGVAERASAKTEVFLDSATIERGFTVSSPDSRLDVGIGPALLPQPTTVSVDLQGNALEPPDGFSFVTQQYQLDIAQDTPQPLGRAVNIRFHLTAPSLWKKSIAFYNATTNSWQFLSTKVRADVATSRLSFPYVRLAVLERPGEFANGTVTAKAAAAIDEEAGTLLAAYHAEEARPIASLAKLMTALAVLDEAPDWEKDVRYEARDGRIGARLRLRVGDVVSIRDLFFSMLVGSANNATAALVRSVGFSDEAFAERMNAKAQALGLSTASFYEPTGLDPQNQASARDILVLMRAALAEPEIRGALETREYTFRTRNTRRLHRIRTTNLLREQNDDVLAGKTGYLDEAGYSLVLERSDPNSQQRVLAVVMGNETSGKRFREADRLSAAALQLLRRTGAVGS